MLTPKLFPSSTFGIINCIHNLIIATLSRKWRIYGRSLSSRIDISGLDGTLPLNTHKLLSSVNSVLTFLVEPPLLLLVVWWTYNAEIISIYLVNCKPTSFEFVVFPLVKCAIISSGVGNWTSSRIFDTSLNDNTGLWKEIIEEDDD
jgi:hypothetical protein